MANQMQFAQYNNTYANGSNAFAHPNVGGLNTSLNYTQETSDSVRFAQPKPAPPSFFSRKVVKPIKGGGKKRQAPTAPNPYFNSDSQNKEFNNIAKKKAHKKSTDKEEMKFYKPPPSINPFTPIIKTDKAILETQKSFTQIQRQAKKKNYIIGYNEAQKMLMEESMGIDESITLEQNSDSDDEGGTSNMLDAIDKSPGNLKQNVMYPQAKNYNANIPTNTIDLGQSNMNQPGNMPNMESADDREKDNPFNKKKKGFASTLSSAFKSFF
jgi:hypothetical protein